MKDETVVNVSICICLTVVAVTCAVTGHNNGLLATIISALSALAGVGLGRATKETSKKASKKATKEETQ